MIQDHLILMIIELKEEKELIETIRKKSKADWKMENDYLKTGSVNTRRKQT